MAVGSATDTPLQRAAATARTAAARSFRRLHRGLIGGTWTWLRVAGWIAGVVLGLLIAGFLWLYFLDWNTMRAPLARYASARLHRPVRIDGELDVDIFRWSPRVSVSGVSIANPGWAGTSKAAALPHLAFSVRLIPFLFGKTILPYVRLDRPDVVVLRRADGTTNWDFGDGNTGLNLPPIQNFLIRDGHVRIDDRVRKLTLVGTVSSQETANGGAAAFQLDGNGTINGKPFIAQIHGGPLINVDAAHPYAFQADVRAGTTRVTAAGSIAHPFHLGQFAATTTFSGQNLSDLYDLTGLAMPQTAPYRIGGTLTRDGANYAFEKFTGVVGQSDLRGTLTVDASGAKPLVRGAVISKVLDFKDLGHVFGGQSTAAKSEGRLLPDLPLHVERLRQMEAELDYDAGTIRSQDFPLRGVHTHIALHNSVLVLKPLAFQFARGRLSGTVTIDAGPAVPVTDVDARIVDLRLEQFFAGDPPPVEGLLEAHAVLSGRGNSVRKVATSASGRAVFVAPQGKFREAFAELTGINLINGLGLLLSGDKSDTGLRCAVADFRAQGGVLRAQRLIFDTDPVRVEGTGSIDLDTETLNLQVIGKPKEFRVGRIHAPITITGALRHPDIGIKPGDALLQGGLAVVLGLVFPPAAIIPFLDPGLAEDANCGALLTEARGQGAPVKRRAR